MKHLPALSTSFALVAVAIIGLTRGFESVPPPVIAATVAAGTIGILLLVQFVQSFRKAFDSTSIETVILSHAMRAPLGVSFIIFSSFDMLPTAFASRAGYGDLAIAILGLIAVAVAPSMSRVSSRRLYIGWNCLGLVDLFNAVGTGVYFALKTEGSMDWITRLPLLVVPTLALPYLFATHFLMLHRLVFAGQQKPLADG